MADNKLSQFPKAIIPRLLDYTPKLKINWVEYNNDKIMISSHIVYIDHKFPIRLNFCGSTDLLIYDDFCQLIDKTINNLCLQSISDKFTLVGALISCGLSFHQFDCKEAFIELLLYAAKICSLERNTAYYCKINNIYSKYCSGNLCNWEINRSLYYGYREFDHTEYENLCKSGEFINYFPIYYCYKKDIPLKIFTEIPNCEKVIIAIGLKKYDNKQVFLFGKDEIGIL